MRILRRSVRLLALVAALVIGLAVLAYLDTGRRLAAEWRVEPEPLALPAPDPELLARGAHVARIRGCRECHGDDLGGGVVIEDWVVGRVVAPNLTAGRGGVGPLGVSDLLRAIRHGVGRDGRTLLVMPSFEYYHLSDADLAALMVWIRGRPPVDRDPGERALALPIRLLLALQRDTDFLAAEKVDHDAPRRPVPEPGPTAAYGAYLALSCEGCHGADFAGGPIPGRPPDWPPAADLTPSGRLVAWDLEDFRRTLRTGTTPEGRVLPPEYMPWPAFAAMTDEETEALWRFLHTLSADGRS